jgi:ferredoxin
MELVGRARSRGYTVFAPVVQDNIVVMAQVDEPTAVHFGHVLTVNTLKDIFLPRCEALAAFDAEARTIEGMDDKPDRILVFGGRPCDAAALAILDAILLEPVRDVRYAGRRARAVIVTLACSEADEACFCSSVGCGPHDAAGSDVLVMPSGGGFVLQAVSSKGEAFLDEIGWDGREAGEPDVPPEVARKVDLGGLKAWLDGNFEHPRWNEVSERCVSCGTCYYLCPTCHCYEITDQAGLSKGERVRIWDCCSFSGFTKMAGHQPRVGRHARYRQRVMHKFKYCPDNIALTACVGCGRCVRHCPYGVDIREVLETLCHEG